MNNSAAFPRNVLAQDKLDNVLQAAKRYLKKSKADSTSRVASPIGASLRFGARPFHRLVCRLIRIA